MHQTTKLLPKPWRLLFVAQTDLATRSTFYQALVQYAVKPFRQMATDGLEIWNVDQATGQFTAKQADGNEFVADVQFLGTHDGKTFMWANCNPSIDQSYSVLAEKTRKALEKDFAQIALEDRPVIGLRDANVLLSFGAEQTNAQMTFEAATDATTVYLALNNIRPLKQPGRRSFFERLRGKKSEPIFDLSSVMQVLNNQWQQHLLAPDALMKIEADLDRAGALFDAGGIDECASEIERAKERMGAHSGDQEPTGWTYFCDALCSLLKGNNEQAEISLAIVRRAIVPPDQTRILLAGARTGNWRESRAIGAYISNPAQFLEFATTTEQETVRKSIQTAMSNRDQIADNPVSVLKAANVARYENAVRAWDKAERARLQRTDAHVLCDADTSAQEENNADFRQLLLIWFNTSRNPSYASLSSNPDENPATLEELVLESQSDDQATILTTYRVDYSDEAKDKYRYVLERKTEPMSEQMFWRISQIWSLWDHEDIRLF